MNLRTRKRTRKKRQSEVGQGCPPCSPFLAFSLVARWPFLGSVLSFSQ